VKNLFLDTRKQLLKQGKEISSSFIGLLWFDNDYIDITEIRGEIEFFSADIDAKKNSFA